MSRTTGSDAVEVAPERHLGELAVVKNLLRLRFCVICHNEMTEEICCTCEAPTVAKVLNE